MCGLFYMLTILIIILYLDAGNALEYLYNVMYYNECLREILEEK